MMTEEYSVNMKIPALRNIRLDKCIFKDILRAKITELKERSIYDITSAERERQRERGREEERKKEKEQKLYNLFYNQCVRKLSRKQNVVNLAQ